MSIKEVAKLAGVSPSTVSRIVNSRNTSAASPETQEKIWDAVRVLGYIPNQSARNLKRPALEESRSNRDIDCIYARVAGEHLDPFFTSLMHAAEVEAFTAGYTIRYYYSALDIQHGNFPRSNSEAESVIVLGRASPETLKLISSQYKNIVCSGLNELSAEIDQVVSSGYAAARKCVEHLISLGHTKICYMGETENEQRFQGYLDSMSSLGLENVMEYVEDTPFTPGGGYDAVQALMRRQSDFTAIFCANDMSAVGALKALKEHHMKVPRDVSLVGINDMETVRYLDPMLTSINIPLEEMGKMVAKLLIDRIEGGHKLPIRMSIPNTLISRESCGPVNERKRAADPVR